VWRQARIPHGFSAGNGGKDKNASAYDKLGLSHEVVRRDVKWRMQPSFKDRKIGKVGRNCDRRGRRIAPNPVARSSPNPVLRIRLGDASSFKTERGGGT
jgi:hypothetical protein